MIIKMGKYVSNTLLYLHTKFKVNTIYIKKVTIIFLVILEQPSYNNTLRH